MKLNYCNIYIFKLVEKTYIKIYPKTLHEFPVENAHDSCITHIEHDTFIYLHYKRRDTPNLKLSLQLSVH